MDGKACGMVEWHWIPQECKVNLKPVVRCSCLSSWKGGVKTKLMKRWSEVQAYGKVDWNQSLWESGVKSEPVRRWSESKPVRSEVKACGRQSEVIACGKAEWSQCLWECGVNSKHVGRWSEVKACGKEWNQSQWRQSEVKPCGKVEWLWEGRVKSKPMGSQSLWEGRMKSMPVEVGEKRKVQWRVSLWECGVKSKPNQADIIYQVTI